MKSSESKALAVIRRVQGFLDTPVMKLTKIIPAPLRVRIDVVVRQLADGQVQQVLATAMARAETAKQAEYRREAYLRFLRPIGRIAMICFGESRQRRSLVMSAASTRQPRFLKRAALVADVASGYPKVFVGHGMTADFVDQFQSLLGQIRSAGDAHHHYIGRQVAATASLKWSARYARDVVGLLDALLTPALKNDPALFAQWAATKRIPAGRSSGVARTPETCEDGSATLHRHIASPLG
jgi:hypothetical protein